ncbi:hypothetical protein [Methylibium petroleiphilum]|uniref:hypothetical protein n=1 Tax=Methylibium petroleiphilum TaxID=105560 RepID=UPI0013053B96|nr:hypothetical protein [Methylibium petroleiphilum]
MYRTTTPASGGQPQVEVLYGASDARFNPATRKIELLADSIPFHSESFTRFTPKPGHGMLMLYGIRDALDELHKWRTKARELGAEFASAEFEVEVGGIEKDLVSKEMLKASRKTNRFLNVRRMKADLQEDVFKCFTRYAKEDGLKVDEDMQRILQIATHPSYFDRLFQEYEDLQDMDVLVIPVADIEIGGRRHIRQAAYVRPGAKILDVRQVRPDVDIVLPAWLTDEKAAAKQLKFAEAMA